MISSSLDFLSLKHENKKRITYGVYHQNGSDQVELERRPLLRCVNGERTLSVSDINKREFLHIKFFFCLIGKKYLRKMWNVEDYFFICLELSSFFFVIIVIMCKLYIYILLIFSLLERKNVWIRNVYLLLIVKVKMRLMDVRVRARAKSTCLVCKRTRDHHHITLKYVWWLLLIYLCMDGVGRWTISTRTYYRWSSSSPRLFFSLCCYHND